MDYMESKSLKVLLKNETNDSYWINGGNVSDHLNMSSPSQ